MLQRTISHKPGRFSRCQCGLEPRHVQSRGRKSDEPGLVFEPVIRHSLECRCGARTELHDTIEDAEAAFGADYAQLSLRLRQRRKHKAAA